MWQDKGRPLAQCLGSPGAGQEKQAALPTHRNRMRTKATPSESSTRPWERPKQWDLKIIRHLGPAERENVMDYCALRSPRPSVFEPCGSALAAERSVQRLPESKKESASGDSWKISSVVGGTRKHEWVEGDKVRIAIDGGAHTTGVVTLPANDHGLWRVRCDGESKTRSVRRGDLFPLPRPLRHLWDASVTYNDRWFESRAELYALLMGRQRRLGKGSVVKWIAGNHIVLRRIAAYALAPVSYLDLQDFYFCIDFWNEAPVRLRPDARRGVVALAYVDRTPPEEDEGGYALRRTYVAGVSAVGVSRLRVLRLEWQGDNGEKPPVYSTAVVLELLGLVSEHCRDLRALRVDGSSIGDGSAEEREPFARVLERCAELRILWAFGCADFMPMPTPGRTYALTHIHTGLIFDSDCTAATFSAWIDAAPNLRHYSCTHTTPQAEEGIGHLEAAAAATHLETLELTEWGDQADEPTDTYDLKRIMSALPQNLRIAPYGTYPDNALYAHAIGDDLRECALLAGREDLEVLKHNYNSRANDEGLMERPMLWDWHEAIKPLCYA